MFILKCLSLPLSEEFSVPFTAEYPGVSSAVILAGYFVVSSVLFSAVQLPGGSSFSDEFSISFVAACLRVSSVVILAECFFVSSVLFFVVQLSDGSSELSKNLPCRSLNMFLNRGCRVPIGSPACVECRNLCNCRLPTF